MAKKQYLVKTSEGYIAEKGYSRDKSKAIRYSSPMKAVIGAENRSGSIDSPITLEDIIVK